MTRSNDIKRDQTR